MHAHLPCAPNRYTYTVSEKGADSPSSVQDEDEEEEGEEEESEVVREWRRRHLEKTSTA